MAVDRAASRPPPAGPSTLWSRARPVRCWGRTSPGSLVDRYADGVPLLLEIDHVDHERSHGWSVVARGRGERVLDGERSAAERGVPGPPRWVRREDEVWIQLRWGS
ncbi:pyridoxamine 5'-phosphate oxidase family protein [Nocardioides maradonensis]